MYHVNCHGCKQQQQTVYTEQFTEVQQVGLSLDIVRCVVCRLDNVIRSDLVIVMDAGLVKETAPPSQLLAQPDSAFSSLVDAGGASSAAALRKMAADFFAERAAGMKVGAKPRPSLEETRRSFQQP